LSPLLLRFVVQHAIRRVQVNQNDLQLNGTHQLLFYDDYFNILDGNAHRILLKNTETLLVRSKEIGLEVNVDKTKYVHGHV
jgi:hypothetical protein